MEETINAKEAAKNRSPMDDRYLLALIWQQKGTIAIAGEPACPSLLPACYARLLHDLPAPEALVLPSFRRMRIGACNGVESGIPRDCGDYC